MILSVMIVFQHTFKINLQFTYGRKEESKERAVLVKVSFGERGSTFGSFQ